MRYPPFIENDSSFPNFFNVTMNYPGKAILNIEAEMLKSLDEIIVKSRINPGDHVAVGIGSRGITDLPSIVKILCDYLKKAGAEPVIIPAMGSHGGAVAQGQAKLCENMGISEAACSTRILSSLDVKKIGTVFNEVPVWFSRDALDMEHSICINRIKPHTKFKAPLESGLFKMLCVGMGKHEGALTFHKWALKYGFHPLLEAMGDKIIEKSNFRFGIGIVEDASDKPVLIKAVPAGQVKKEEQKLLKIAKDNFPTLPFDKLDVLIIEQIGKDISGAGMDPNVTGRAYDLKEDDFSSILDVTRLAILNLSDKTAGNGIGLGNADIITEKVFQNLDYETTIINALTSMSLRKAFLPVRLPDDQKAIRACFTTIGPVKPEDVRAVIIKNTRHVRRFWASQALYEEIQAMKNATIGRNICLKFDRVGNLLLPELSE
ncbi:hypothetical protein QUF76_06940 [Desulfobacterales bacterium HSG16]|nr:hypothetical protein [Desulfobacterales bacterium HSG16]